MDTYTVIYLITNICNVLLIREFMHLFFMRRRTGRALCAVSYFSYFLLTGIVYLAIDIPLLTLSVNFLVLFGIALNYDADIWKQFLGTVYVLAFMLLPELIVGAGAGYLGISFFIDGNYSDSAGLVSMRLLTFMELQLFKNKKSARQNRSIGIAEWMAFLLIPFLTLVLEMMFISCRGVTQSEAVISVIFVFLLNFAAFYLYDSLSANYMRREKTLLLEKEKELYCRQCEIMQSSVEETRAFRHDLNNQFAVISGLLAEGDYEAVKQQFLAISQKIESRTVYSATGNLAVDAIINYKLQNAAACQIRVLEEIAVPSDLDIGVYDIVVILGNLLDNALTAVMEMPGQERFLSVKLLYNRGRLVIRVVNPFQGNVPYEGGKIVTSSGDKAHHGYGLKNVRKVVDAYGGFMEIRHEEQVFIVDILLYLRGQ